MKIERSNLVKVNDKEDNNLDLFRKLEYLKEKNKILKELLTKNGMILEEIQNPNTKLIPNSELIETSTLHYNLHDTDAYSPSVSDDTKIDFKLVGLEEKISELKKSRKQLKKKYKLSIKESKSRKEKELELKKSLKKLKNAFAKVETKSEKQSKQIENLKKENALIKSEIKKVITKSIKKKKALSKIITTKKDQVSTLEKYSNKQSEEIASIKDKYEYNLTQLQSSFESKEKQLVEFQETVKTLKSELDNKSFELRKLETLISNQTSKIDQISKAKEDLDIQNTSLSNKVNNALTQIKSFQSEIVNLKSTINIKDIEYKSLSAEKDNLQKDFETLLTKFNKLEENSNNTINKLEKLQGINSSLNTQVTLKDKDLISIRKAKNLSERKQSRLELKYNLLRDQLKENKLELSKRQRKLIALNRQFTHTSNEIERLEEHNHALLTDISNIKSSFSWKIIINIARLIKGSYSWIPFFKKKNETTI